MQRGKLYLLIYGIILKKTLFFIQNDLSINDADSQQEKTNIENEENQSVIVEDEKNDIPLEYVIPTYDKFNGFAVGWSINQPVYSGQRFELEKYKPIFGIMIASPISFSFSRFTIGFGLGVESGNEKSSLFGTVNMRLFGKFSLIGGIGSINDDGVHFGAESQGGKLKPYRVHLLAGQEAKFGGWILNPFPPPETAVIELVGPDDWKSQVVEVELEPREQKEIRISISLPDGSCCRRQPIGLDLTVGGRPFGQVAEALVSVGVPKF